MKRRFLLHCAFWLAYWFIYAYTYSRYDGNFLKFAASEGWQMPARILATYASFWLLDRWQTRPVLGLSGVALSVFAGGLLNRFVKWIYLVPAYFPDSTFDFWGYRLMVDVFDCALAAAVAIAARLYFRQQDGRRRETLLVQERTAAEMEALKSQIHPHFLFNTLNNIYALARKKSDQTAPLALKLAQFLRYVLYETKKERTTLDKELDILADYIALEQVRFSEDRLEVRFDKSVESPAYPLPPLLLLPLVENAFKHGAGENRHDARVHIAVRQSGDVLFLSVRNSVRPGMEDNSEGIGLNNLRRRLELVYGDKARLRIGRDSGTFTAELEIQNIWS